MGLAVLPSRLKGELETLADYIVSGKDIRSNADLEKHADWVEDFTAEYQKQGKTIDASNVEEILQQEVGKVFCQVLEDAGVFKCNDEGLAAFRRFVAVL
jgi:UDPglucose--hexose-1-phosphate uridylyltransferase